MRQMSPLPAPDRSSGLSHSYKLLPFAAYGLFSAAMVAAAPVQAAAPAQTQEEITLEAPLHSLPLTGADTVGTVLTSGDADFLSDDVFGPPVAPVTSAAQPSVSYSGSMEPCLLGHGQRDLYRAGLQAMGWVDVSEAGRPVAIAMLADAFLPITGAMDGPWAEHLAHRPASQAFWADMAQNRTLMEREGRILLLAGFLDPNGEMRVECWTAGPETNTTDSFFLLAGQVWQSEGVMMTQLNIPATAVTAETEILVSRITPPAPMQPPLAASDGLRTTTIFPMNGSQL